MSEQLRESVSALMDGEADEMEVRRLLVEGNKDVVLKTWSRYHAISDVLQDKGAGEQFKHIEISQKISEAIATENVSAVVDKRGSTSIFKSISGFAVAASVTVAVVVGMQNVQLVASSGVDTNSIPAVSSRVYLPNNTASNVSFGGSDSVSRQRTLPNSRPIPNVLDASKVIADFEAQKRLDKFILRHTERAALNNGQGMISYARVASFDTP